MSAGDGPVVLAVESSCDETAAAILTGPSRLLASVVHSQIEEHARFGGVVPELASRNHALAISVVAQQALEAAGLGVSDVQAIVVTSGPGLVGSLLVGVEFAKGLAMARDLPLVGVHHLEGHVMAPHLAVAAGFAPPAFPCVALLASGGHTSLVHCVQPGQYRLLGRTLDDAAGEAYDKVGKMIGLPYPGGPHVDRLAAGGDPTALAFPRPLLRRGNLDFSFSGIKTAVLHAVQRGAANSDQGMRDLCASFQAAAAEVLVSKSIWACRAAGVRHLTVSGGVACNRGLRAALGRAQEQGISVSVPPPDLCTDNAAMIGAAGYHRAAALVASGRRFEAHALDARPAWPLDQVD